jgi:hypothetical protein
MWAYSRGLPFTYPSWCGFNLVDGVPVDGVPVDGVPVDGVPVDAWLYFSGLRVGQIHLYEVFFLFVCLIIW